MDRDVVTGDPGAGRPPGPGTVYWLTGLAGAGKTTLGRLTAERLRALGRPAVFLDGDGLRAALWPDAGFAPDERLALARRYARLCGLLGAEGVDVVCATISLFPEVWEENRRTLPSYREVLVRAPRALLVARKPDLYARHGEHVVGGNAPAALPPTPDLVLDNDGSRTPQELVDELVARLGPPAARTTT